MTAYWTLPQVTAMAIRPDELNDRAARHTFWPRRAARRRAGNSASFCRRGTIGEDPRNSERPGRWSGRVDLAVQSARRSP